MKIRLLFGLILLHGIPHPLPGQEAVLLPDAATGEINTEQNTVQSLEALQRALNVKEVELASLLEELSAATDDATRDDLRNQIKALRAEIEDQRRQFDGFAADIDLSVFSPQPHAKFDWQEQVGKLLEPIMAELQSATAESRQIGQLRTQIEEVTKRRDLAQRAVDNLQALLKQPVSADLEARLKGRLQVWSRTLDQADNEYTALELQLQSRLASRESVLDQSTKFVRHFFRTRGVNLLLGLLAFLLVFFGFRLADYLVRRSRRVKGEKTFSTRLTSLMFHLGSVLGGLLAMMAMFNLVGDWFLLGIIVIFLFGVGWAGIKTLPQQIETIKLMLNIGAVREGQALVFDGTLYRVENLGFSAKLCNPALEGGMRILPVKYMVGMTSRPTGPNEVWFPTQTGDWVELADGVYGQVVSQTPSSVAVRVFGGAVKAYQTGDFLAQKPKNLSAGFRVETTFGVDYQHQAEAVTELPQRMKLRIQQGLTEFAGENQVKAVHVLLAQAGASSLEYYVGADMAGASASRAAELKLILSGLLVDACQQNGWIIPFTQVVVHQARRASNEGKT